MRRLIFAALIVCCCAGALLARPGTLRTKDGRTIEGDIAESGDQVTITMRAGSISLAKDEVASITYALGIKEQYEQRLAKLPKNATARDRVELGRWLYENKEYDLARSEADKAQALEPNNADAAMLKQTIDRTILWERTKAQNGASPNATGTPRPATRPAGMGVATESRPLLNAEQINRIRQAEFREADRVRFRFENDVRRRFTLYIKMNPTEFASLPDSIKAQRILTEGTPDMRKDVRVAGDPAVIADFRLRVQPILLAGCATSNCHAYGSPQAKGFYLHSPSDREEIVYTNYYILTQYRAMLDGAERRAINRQQPKDSLIAELGLPREVSEVLDHPQAQDWTPCFKGPADPRYNTVVAWISALNPVPPDYGFLFPVPGLPPATQPIDPAGNPRDVQRFPPSSPPPPPPSNNRNGSDAGDTLRQIRERMRPVGIQ